MSTLLFEKKTQKNRIWPKIVDHAPLKSEAKFTFLSWTITAHNQILKKKNNNSSVETFSRNIIVKILKCLSIHTIICILEANFIKFGLLHKTRLKTFLNIFPTVIALLLFALNEINCGFYFQAEQCALCVRKFIYVHNNIQFSCTCK